MHRRAVAGPKAFRGALAHTGTTSEAPIADRTLGDLVGIFLADAAAGAHSGRGRPYSAKTVKVYREGLGVFVRLAPRLGVGGDLRQLQSAQLEAYARELRAAGARPATVSARLNVLAPFLKWAVTKGYLTSSPLLPGSRPRGNTKTIRPYTTGEVQAMLDACAPETWLGARDRAVMLVLLDTGLRAQEAVSLDLEDLSTDSWQLHVKHGKGDKERLARLGLQARGAVEKWMVDWRGGQAGPLFPSRYGRRLAPDALWELVRRVARVAGVTDAHPHRFRHTFAIQFLRAGGDALKLQLLLGHSTLEMTRRYCQALDAQDALAAHALASPGDTLGLKPPRRSRSA